MRKLLLVGVAALLLPSGFAQAQYYGPPGYGGPPPPGYYGPPPCPPDRGALRGAAAGAAAGAVLGGLISGRPGQGAVLGGLIGGLASASRGGSRHDRYCR